jgi:hypothetical protein
MAGPYQNSFTEDGFSAPASNAFAITPSDTVLFANDTRGIYVGGAGNITVLMQGGGVVLFTAVPAGTILPIRADRVNATGTTATALVGLL